MSNLYKIVAGEREQWSTYIIVADNISNALISFYKIIQNPNIQSIEFLSDVQFVEGRENKKEDYSNVLNKLTKYLSEQGELAYPIAVALMVRDRDMLYEAVAKTNENINIDELDELLFNAYNSSNPDKTSGDIMDLFAIYIKNVATPKDLEIIVDFIEEKH
jgi:hypothetical protein